MTSFRISAALLSLAAAALSAGTVHGQSSTPSDWIEVRGGAWTVDTGTFVDMAGRLQKAADAAPKPPADAKPVPMDGYTLQYQGMVQEGTKMIHVLGACKVEGAMMRKLAAQWNMVADGGVCYFQADYNPASKTYTKFSFNGQG